MKIFNYKYKISTDEDFGQQGNRNWCKVRWKLQLRRNTFYSTMGDIKAAFPERTKRSWKNYFYRYMEDHGYKKINKLSQSITALNSRNHCSITWFRRMSTISTLCLFCTASHRENNDLETEFASQNKTQPSGMVLSHSLWRMFLEFLQFFSRKPLTYRTKGENVGIIHGKFGQNELINVV